MASASVRLAAVRRTLEARSDRPVSWVNVRTAAKVDNPTSGGGDRPPRWRGDTPTDWGRTLGYRSRTRRCHCEREGEAGARRGARATQCDSLMFISVEGTSSLCSHMRRALFREGGEAENGWGL